MSTAGTDVSGQHQSEAGTADRGRRPFEFLAEVQRLKSPPKLTTDRYQDVFWLSDLPDRSGVRFASDLPDADSDTPMVVVDRP